MRVAQFSEFGGPQKLHIEQAPDPSPGTGDVLIKVSAVGLNFFDTPILRNEYQVSPPLPFSPGAEVAGMIESVGEGVADFKLGQRVVAFIGGNGCREKVITKAKNAIPIPDGVSDEVAAGISVTYGTALHALKDRAQLMPGETIAVAALRAGLGLPPSRSPSSWAPASLPSPPRATSLRSPASTGPTKASIIKTRISRRGSRR
jgi:NADPH:quinone reductase